MVSDLSVNASMVAYLYKIRRKTKRLHINDILYKGKYWLFALSLVGNIESMAVE